MKKFFVLVSLLVAVALSACGGDTAETQSYDLAEIENSGVSGKVIFEKISDTETKIDIELDGTVAGSSHPAHIHVGDAEDNGAIYVSLSPVDGETGKSTITVTKNQEGADVTYEQLIAFDGYVNIHASMDDLAKLLAQGETGAGAN